MPISGNNSLSQLKSCALAAGHFLLSQKSARNIFETPQAVIEDNWQTVCDEGQLSDMEPRLLWRRQFLNPFSVELE